MVQLEESSKGLMDAMEAANLNGKEAKKQAERDRNRAAWLEQQEVANSTTRTTAAAQKVLLMMYEQNSREHMVAWRQTMVYDKRTDDSNADNRVARTVTTTNNRQ